MLMFLWPIWVLLSSVEGQGGPPPPDGGPGEMECILLLTSPMYVCEDDLSQSYLDMSKVDTVRHNDTMSYVTGTMILKKAFDLDTMVEIQVSKFANGKKEMMMTIEMDFCKEMGDEDGAYWKLLQYLGFPPECPISPGEYPINNLVVDMDDLPINSANIGDYEATMVFKTCHDSECKESTFEACVKLDCVIEPID